MDIMMDKATNIKEQEILDQANALILTVKERTEERGQVLQYDDQEKGSQE